MAVAQMVCEDTPVSYFDYENTTTPRMADTMDCTVDKKVVCEPVTTKKCAEVTYTRCEEVRIVYICHTPPHIWTLRNKTASMNFNKLFFSVRGSG
jgi:hypothetical protein